MISVVIPTFKRPNSLKRLLISIISQKEQPEEILIIDDCSEMVNEYQKVISELPKSNIKINYLSNQKNMGAPYSRNKGILKAKNKWIALVDDDDFWLEDKLSLQKEIIKKFPQYAMISCWSYIKSNDKFEIFRIPSHYAKNPKRYILETNFLMSPTMLIKKEALLNNRFDISLPSCQDWDLWTSLITKGYKLYIIDIPLTIYTKDNINSIGLSKNAKKGYRIFIRKHCVNIIRFTPITNWIKMFLIFLKTFI